MAIRRNRSKGGGGFSLTPFPVPDTLPTTSQNSKHGVNMQATEAVPSSNSDFKSIASAMARRGVHVVPTYPGLRHPALPDWQNLATTDSATITNWGSNGYADYNCCSVAKKEGAGMLDIDDLEAARRQPAPGGILSMRKLVRSARNRFPASTALGRRAARQRSGTASPDLCPVACRRSHLAWAAGWD